MYWWLFRAILGGITLYGLYKNEDFPEYPPWVLIGKCTLDGKIVPMWQDVESQRLVAEIPDEKNKDKKEKLKKFKLKENVTVTLEETRNPDFSEGNKFELTANSIIWGNRSLDVIVWGE